MSDMCSILICVLSPVTMLVSRLVPYGQPHSLLCGGLPSFTFRANHFIFYRDFDPCAHLFA